MRREKFKPQESGMRVIGRVEDSISMANDPGRDRLNDPVAKAPCRVLAHSPLNRTESRTKAEGILSGSYGGVNSGAASSPHGLLGGQLAGKIQRFFQTPCRHKASYSLWPESRNEFLSLKFSLQKILPSPGGLIFRDKLPVVGYAFRSDTDSTKKTEIVIFLTPKIVTGDLEDKKHLSSL